MLSDSNQPPLDEVEPKGVSDGQRDCVPNVREDDPDGRLPQRIPVLEVQAHVVRLVQGFAGLPAWEHLQDRRGRSREVT